MDDAGETGSEASALPEPVRQRLLDLAADVLGRLPVDEVPLNLRAFARFTPTKRRRMGGGALAVALDADDGFRCRVATALADGPTPAVSAELAQAVADGRTPAAADPVEVAVLAYLVRPPGWQAVLAAAARQGGHEQAAVCDHESELALLRQQVADLRRDLKGEPSRTRAAVTAARADADRLVADLRRVKADQTRLLREAERAREAAAAEGVTSRTQADRQAAAHEAELRRLRGRLAEVERSAEAGRRETRAEREVDDARLWLLVDTLTRAAAGVRSELSLTPAKIVPADTVQSAGGEGGSRTVADAAALGLVLGMPNVHLVIDGYNVTKTGYGDLPLESQRTRLVRALAPLAAQSGAEVTVVFDGGTRPPAQPPVPRGVRVLFSAADEIADDLIRRLVRAEPPGRPIVVVTSDQEVVRDTARAGAWTTASGVLLARLGTDPSRTVGGAS